MRRRQLAGRVYYLWQNQSGLSMLELILAIVIISLTMTALVVISNNTLSTSGSSRNQAVADRYAREGIEFLRDYRDNNGWAAFRRVGGFSTDHPTWNATGMGTAPPSCVRNNTKRYYYGMTLPASGVVTPYSPNTRAFACGTDADFAPGGSNYESRWLNDFCKTSVIVTDPDNKSTLEMAKVRDNYYRFVIIGYETADRAFIRSTVCYYENQQIRSVQVDGYLTNWQ